MKLKIETRGLTNYYVNKLFSFFIMKTKKTRFFTELIRIIISIPISFFVIYYFNIEGITRIIAFFAVYMGISLLLEFGKKAYLEDKQKNKYKNFR